MKDDNTPTIVTICGSMRFYQQMLETAAEETVKGHIVLMPFKSIPENEQNSDLKAMLDRLHKIKIDMCDYIIVVTNQHGYIGTSTRKEMVYAAQKLKLLDGTWDVREYKNILG